MSIAHFGISTALLTPFHADGSLNLGLLCQHAQDMLGSGLQGVTLFGTTGEGASMGLQERQDALVAMTGSGINPKQITLGLCGSALADVHTQLRQGLEAGVTRFLLMPPFYFKGVDDTGLFDWHAGLFEMADSAAQFILYHIPQITQIPLSLDLIMRLKRAFPDHVLAVKDSAGNWDNTRALLESGKIATLVGDERLLHKAAALGAAGSICGMANLYPARLKTLFETHLEDSALCADVDLIVSGPVIPALKLAMVAKTGNTQWAHLRAPLRPLEGTARDLIAARFSSMKATA
ncbi:dihydrodipicolinate synthase family protein [Roseobacter sp. EG26]|uniref:dihydrodipicolinate synthase family protein n=1 Tax=Roseobacter sp. EG26 TaxID=3412477 RepID=UPI003CE47137